MSAFSDWREFEQAVLASDYCVSRDTVARLAANTATPSQAFALAYQAAIVRLVPDLSPRCWAAFCVSEAQGNHPRQLQTQASLDLEGHIGLHGEKTFVTHGKHAEQLVVIAKSHLPQESDRLRAYYLKRETNGAEIIESRPAGILPELDHGKLKLYEAHASFLPGDGHNDYSKRFRLLEDQFMLAVFCWHIVAQVQRLDLDDGSLALAANALAGQVKMQSELDANDTLALSSLYEQFMNVSDEYTLALEAHIERQKQWQRDSKLFLLGQKTRDIRTLKAKQRLSDIERP